MPSGLSHLYLNLWTPHYLDDMQDLLSTAIIVSNCLKGYTIFSKVKGRGVI